MPAACAFDRRFFDVRADLLAILRARIFRRSFNCLVGFHVHQQDRFARACGSSSLRIQNVKQYQLIAPKSQRLDRLHDRSPGFRRNRISGS